MVINEVLEKNYNFPLLLVDLLFCKSIFSVQNLKVWVQCILGIIYDQFSKTA